MLVNIKRTVLCFLIIIILLPATAQRHTISGYVKDMSNGEMLIGASVFVKDSYIGTVTNPYGFYSLSLIPGEHIIVYQYQMV